ncbi:MAG: hypothetical protein ACYDHN_06960 [Solirubrobacteraceae bacterium]
MSRKTGSTRVWLVLTVALVMSCFMASGANAATGGPEWLVNGTPLGAGQARVVGSTNVGTIRITTGIAVFTCQQETGNGELLGGNPGTGVASVSFKQCAVEGKPTCTLSSVPPLPEKRVSGEVKFSVKEVLAYQKGSRAVPEYAVVPIGTGTEPNTLAKLEIGGTNCGVLNGKVALWKATGTIINEPAFSKHCAMLAQVGQIASGTFGALTALTQVHEGGLSFGSQDEAELWSPGSGTFKTIVCESELLGGNATFASVAKVETVPSTVFGWQT